MNLNDANPGKRRIQSVSGVRGVPRSLRVIWLVPALSIVLGACGSPRGNTDSTNRSASPAVEAENGVTPPERESPNVATVPAGSTVSVRLLHSISSNSASQGQELEAELSAPIETRETVLFGRTARVRGHVVSAKRSGRLHHPGTLRLTLDSIQAPGGNWIAISTTSVTVRGKSHARRNAALIGGGTGIGALIGGIAGGGKGAVIGAAAGAGAGTAGAYATGRKEAGLPAEARLTFKITRDIVVSR